MTIAAGDSCPDVTFEDGDGIERSLIKYRSGRPLVVCFYPKDDTPGCTTEAKAFSEHGAAFAALGVAVLGVSKDSREKHAKFTAKHGLTVALATDATGALCEAFGVWGERSMYGKPYMGIERATFLVDAGGRVTHVWRKVNAAGHVEAVLDAARETTGG